MQFKNTDKTFGAVTITLHWVMAVLLIGLLALGLYMEDLPVSLLKLKLYGWHKEFGLLVLMLAFMRIFWRLSNMLPALNIPIWEKMAARTVHWLFYGFMFALPITGWLISSAAGLPVSFFGLFVMPDLIGPNPALMQLFASIHQWLGYGLIATILLHTLAALKHHYINKDDILRRML